jgi:hypothetical protein
MARKLERTGTPGIRGHWRLVVVIRQQLARRATVA